MASPHDRAAFIAMIFWIACYNSLLGWDLSPVSADVSSLPPWWTFLLLFCQCHPCLVTWKNGTSFGTPQNLCFSIYPLLLMSFSRHFLMYEVCIHLDSFDSLGWLYIWTFANHCLIQPFKAVLASPDYDEGLTLFISWERVGQGSKEISSGCQKKK